MAFAADLELPQDHPLYHTLEKLFENPSFLESRKSFADAGFMLHSHNHRGIVIAEHADLPGHLLKVFINDIPHELQLRNLASRVEGAQALQEFSKNENLTRIVVPNKWLFPLKENVSGITHLLIVEKLDIIESSSALQAAYASIDLHLLDELCRIVKKFRGLDSILKNMPYTRDGKIAFIDTEKWKSPRSGFLHYVRPLLNDQQNEVVAKYYEDSLDRYLMTEEHPAYKALRKLFSDIEIFDSPTILREAGFEVNRRVHKNMMVFTHPKVKNYIFKRFTNDVDLDKQLELYLKRLKGAEVIRKVIKKNGFQNVIVPKKWLFQLPYDEGEYLVVAERFDLCSGDDHPTSENVLAYKNIDHTTLEEYCTLMSLIGGCDAWPRNQPFTKDGKIAFIDTEHVGQKEAHFQKHILPLLDPERQLLAMEWFLAA